MDPQVLLSLVIFCIVLYGSPGPSVIALAVAGAHQGFRRSLPFVAGILLGFYLNLLIAAYGLGALFDTWPWARAVMRWVSLLYLLYLAWRIASAPLTQSGDKRSFGFTLGLLLNLLNPKAYAVAIAALSQYVDVTNYHASALPILSVIAIVVTAIDVGWCYLGALIGHRLTAHRTLNITLAALLVVIAVVATLSLAPINSTLQS